MSLRRHVLLDLPVMQNARRHMRQFSMARYATWMPGTSVAALSLCSALNQRDMKRKPMTQGAQSGSAAPQTAGLTEEVQSLATNLARTVKDKAADLVEEQKAAAVEQVDSIASLIEDVAGKVEQEVPVIAPYLREAASSIHRVSSRLRERSPEDLLQEVSEFGRRRPAALVGASLIAGFALARFLKSSADRRGWSRTG